MRNRVYNIRKQIKVQFWNVQLKNTSQFTTQYKNDKIKRVPQ